MVAQRLTLKVIQLLTKLNKYDIQFTYRLYYEHDDSLESMLISKVDTDQYIMCFKTTYDSDTDTSSDDSDDDMDVYQESNLHNVLVFINKTLSSAYNVQLFTRSKTEDIPTFHPFCHRIVVSIL